MLFLQDMQNVGSELYLKVILLASHNSLHSYRNNLMLGTFLQNPAIVIGFSMMQIQTTEQFKMCSDFFQASVLYH